MAEPVRFFLDQNVPVFLVAALAQRGIDALHAQTAGRCGYDDPDQLAYASANERAVVTFDRDFIALHNAGASHAGIVWAPLLKYTARQIIDELTVVHAVHTAEQLVDHLVYL